MKIPSLPLPHRREKSREKLVLLSFREERMKRAYTLRNESEEKSFREMLTPT